MANRSIRDDRGGPLMRPAPAMAQTQTASPASFAPSAPVLPKPAPTLASSPPAQAGLGQPAVQASRVQTPRPAMPPAPIPNATGPGTTSPAQPMAQPGVVPVNPLMRR